MITDYVDLYLIKNFYYTYKQSLDKVEYIFTLRYSSREQCWYMDLQAADTTPLVMSTKLVPEYPMLDDFVIPGLDGFFWLSPNNSENMDLYYTQPESIPEFFTLRYFYEA